MSAVLRLAGFLILTASVALLAVPGRGYAAAPRDVENAVKRGTAALQDGTKAFTGDDGHAFGIQALAGLALLEAGVPEDDPAVRAIATRVRNGTFTQTQTYSIALCLLFLDRLGDPADVPLVQLLGVRLLAGQNAQGGWGYACVPPLQDAELQRLRTALKVNELVAGKPKSEPATPGRPNPVARPKVAGKLHAEVIRYAATLSSVQRGEDDNSNTQFAIMGLWAARRNGVPVEKSLMLLESRFLRSQAPTGGWGYRLFDPATPSMTCAGLLGVATGLARRDERKLTADTRPAPKAGAKPAKPSDPFFDPPKAEPDPKKKPDAKHVPDVRELAARRGVVALAGFLDGLTALTRGATVGEGRGDLYFLWSVERVGVVYDLPKINGVDWFDVGSDTLLRIQSPDGSWPSNHGPIVGTSLALLFLQRSNLTRDLKATKDDDQFAELRSGAPKTPPPPAAKEPPPAVASVPAPPATPVKPLPAVVADPAIPIAGALLNATDAEWTQALAQLRDAKGADHTRGLVLAVNRLEGSRKKMAREALAERLTRMTAATLREMLKSDEPELRRSAALACAMKDDAGHIPDLIARLGDESPLVWPAAKAGLKSLTAQDFGPPANALPAERREAAEAWKSWHAKQPK